ncbi:MAG: hypothetical protein GY835_18150 [bacterium]|nr:hypothetical protein [bacterium]
MSDSPSLEAWNRHVLMLSQALLGAISPNFRMVALGNEDKRWKLTFFLERESKEDRIEIEDVAAEFEALQETRIEYNIEVLITQDPIVSPTPPTRVVFRRREP